MPMIYQMMMKSSLPTRSCGHQRHATHGLMTVSVQVQRGFRTGKRRKYIVHAADTTDDTPHGEKTRITPPSVMAPSHADGPTVSTPPPSKMPVKVNRVLPLLSELIEIQAITTAVENLAGRSAMLGFVVALTVESMLPMGIFGGLNPGQTLSSSLMFGSHDHGAVAVMLGGSFLVLCASLAAYASTKKENIGSRFLEPTMVALTSHGDTSVSKINVDRALESTMESIFTPAFLRKVFQLSPVSSD